MLQYIKDLSIRFKIAGFIIPSTIAFGILMTGLSLYFLHDYEETSIHDFQAIISEIQGDTNLRRSTFDTKQIVKELSQKADDKIEDIAFILISIVAAVIIMATIGAIIISGFIAKPVQNVARGLQNISSGDADLTERLPVTTADETGKVCLFFNRFLEKLHDIIKNLKMSSTGVNDAALSIHSLIGRVRAKTSSSKELSQTVYRSAGYMSTDMTEISSILGESTTNIHTISSSIEELSKTVHEISTTSSQAQLNTETTKNKMMQLESDVQELGQAGDDISKVTETIAEISEQVNLLALNATIEAARAGEAGKGFAVVANEIKVLAHQTANAASEIQTRIDQVQHVTKTTIAGILDATEVVSGNTDVVATIASAVEQQRAAVVEIAASLSNATEKLDYSNSKISKASGYASDMAEMVNSVTNQVEDVDDAMSSITKTSETLKGLADTSAHLTNQFRT